MWCVSKKFIVVHTGIQKHVLGVVLCTTALVFLNIKRDEYHAEKDAVLRHYIELHPDDFVEPGEYIFHVWV